MIAADQKALLRVVAAYIGLVYLQKCLLSSSANDFFYSISSYRPD